MDSAKKDLLKILVSIDNPEKLEALLHELLTEKEFVDVVLRWRLMEGLYKGRSQRAIAHDFGISLCKITRGSRILKNEESECKKYLKELYKNGY